MLRSQSPSLPQLQGILSNSAPPTEAVAAAPGSGDLAARDDHKHPRLSSATVNTLGGNGEVTINFTRKFTAMPAVQCLLIEAADNQPVVFKVKSWIMDGTDYIGCVIKGYRMQTLPSVIGLVGALVNFNMAAGNPAGAQFCCLAIQPSS